MKKYCKVCGQKLKFISTQLYNEYTGELIQEGVCPSFLCGHTGHTHEWIECGFLWNLFTSKLVCKKCNYRI